METKKPRHYEAKLSLYPMKFEDAIKAIAKAKPESKKRGHQKKQSWNSLVRGFLWSNLTLDNHGICSVKIYS